MHNFLKGLTLGVTALTSVEYFKKYNLLDTLRDVVNAITRHKLGETGSLVVVLAIFGVLLYFAFR